ncbi:MAG: RNA polymerase sigma factor [Planctomycetota bacterium]
MTAMESEPDLIREAIAGDRAALARILLAHYDELHHHIELRISRELQGVLRADDVLQQTFVKAAQGIRVFQIRHDRAFRGWLKTIADNLVRDAEKRRRRERRGRPGGSSERRSRLRQLMCGNTSPSGRAAREEAARGIRAAMDRLSPEQQDVLRRRYFQNQTLEEIAVALGRSKDGIRGLCFRARKNLRAAMGRTSLYFSSGK